MKVIITALLAAWIGINAIAAIDAQAAPVGSQSWWDEMDREGRGGRGS